MSDSEWSATRKIGEEARHKVFDEGCIASVTEDPNEHYQAYVGLMSEIIWGRVWTESSLSEDMKLRINIAVFTALGDPKHTRPYIEAALARGMEQREIADIITRTALYTGFPKGYHAMQEFCEACKEHDGSETATSGTSGYPTGADSGLRQRLVEPSVPDVEGPRILAQLLVLANLRFVAQRAGLPSRKAHSPRTGYSDART